MSDVTNAEANQKSRRKNRLRWFFWGSLAFVIGIPSWAWVRYGLAEHYATAVADYDRIEATGYPLGTASYAESFGLGAYRSDSDELLFALDENYDLYLQVSKSQSSSGSSDAYILYSLLTRVRFEEPGRTPPSDTELRDAFQPFQETLARIRQSSKISKLSPDYDWRNPGLLGFVITTNYSFGVKVLVAEAVLYAKRGDRARADQNLAASTRLFRLMNDQPLGMTAFLQYSMATSIAIGVTECTRADPAGAAEYRNRLGELTLLPFSRDIHSSAVAMARHIRLRSPENLLRTGFGEKLPPVSLPSRPLVLSDEHVPADPVRRAYMGLAMKHYAAILTQIRPDGTIIDRAKYDEAVKAAEELATSNPTPLTRLFRDEFVSPTLLENAHREAKEKHAVAQGAIALLEYRHRTGKWPGTLPDIGPAGKLLGYKVDKETVTVWSLWLKESKVKQKLPDFREPDGAEIVLN